VGGVDGDGPKEEIGAEEDKDDEKRKHDGMFLHEITPDWDG
jgi:hypothetical protein